MEAMARLVLCLPDNNSHIPLQTVRLPEGVSQYLQFYLREFCISQVTLWFTIAIEHGPFIDDANLQKMVILRCSLFFMTRGWISSDNHIIMVN